MAQAEQFTIGAEARCTDGVCGVVSRVVVDPVARVLTHLVVEPKHRQGLGRLVPVDLAEPAAGKIRLRCTLTEFGQFSFAEETQFVPGSSGYAAYGPQQVLAWPWYGLAGAGVRGDTLEGASPTITYDSLPLGEVAVRRDAHVQAADGPIGRVRGLVIDPGSHRVTHVLLQEGHLWGRKEVAIPITAVTAVDGGIQLSMSRDDVLNLPPVDIGHPEG